MHSDGKSQAEIGTEAGSEVIPPADTVDKAAGSAGYGARAEDKERN